MGPATYRFAANSNLDGDLRYCFHEFEKILQPVIALTEYGVLLGCLCEELSFHQRPGYWAVTLVVQSLNDADKESPGVLNFQKRRPVIL